MEENKNLEEVKTENESVKEDTPIITLDVNKKEEVSKEDVDDVLKELSHSEDDIMNMVLSSSKKGENMILEFDDDLLNTINIFDFKDKEQKAPERLPDIEKKEIKKVDIKSLTINNKNALEKEKDLKIALFGSKSAFQVVAAQSGYNAKVSPLVNKDIYNILNSNLSRYEYRKAVYECLWNKIIDTSVGRMSFEDWLKCTSIEDSDTFYYALYCSTFQNQKNFNFTCPKCKSEASYVISHNNLIKAANKDEMQKLITEINSNANSIEKMKEYSLVGADKNEAFELSDSGIVVDIKTPSLWDSLELLRTVSEETITKDADAVTNLLYVDKIFVPSANKESYSEQAGRMNILKIIDNLSIDDANELERAINERLDRHKISYSIKNITCQSCKHTVKDIPINIEDILFTAIFEKSL